jgi:hypothetical protein
MTKEQVMVMNDLDLDDDDEDIEGNDDLFPPPPLILYTMTSGKRLFPACFPCRACDSCWC